MPLRHPLLRRKIAEHPALLCVRSPHLLLTFGRLYALSGNGHAAFFRILLVLLCYKHRAQQKGQCGSWVRRKREILMRESRNRSGIMPLCPDAANREAGSQAETSGRVAVTGRRAPRGKNDFALPPGSRMRQCKESRDGETRASLGPQNVLSRVLA